MSQETTMYRYHPTDDVLKQFHQALKLCVVAFGSKLRRSKANPNHLRIVENYT